MKKYILFSMLLCLSAVSLQAQFPQIMKGRDRLEESERASAAARDGKPLPEPFRAKMNVDVQMVVARQDVKTFAEAKPLAVKQVADGEPLWLYIKVVNGELGKYVVKATGDNSEMRNLLAVAIGAPGDMFAKSHYILSFSDAELKQTEIKIALTNGIPGRNRSLPIFLKTVTAQLPRPGVAPLEVRLLNQFGFPRGANEYLAKIPLAFDLTKGAAKYQPMLAAYASGVLRGTADRSKLPVEGKFDDAGIRTRLTNELQESGVEPEKLWFAADDWLEFSEAPMSVMQTRTMPAAFTYRRDGACFYGVVEITQPFDPMQNGYGASAFKIERDIAMPCTQQ